MRLATLAGLCAAALCAGGCSTSYQLGSFFGKDETKADQTAVVSPVVTPAKLDRRTEKDLALAKAAAVSLLSNGAKDASTSWQNPRTGARGTVTPIAAAYAQNGTMCQDFLASHVQGTSEVWYQGGACRHGRAWEVREFKPLRRT